jgi:hypothetical protein
VSIVFWGRLSESPDQGEMGEIQLRPAPLIGVYADPAGALDARTKRVVQKQLRAAWGAKGARWLSNLDSRTGAGPAF